MIDERQLLIALRLGDLDALLDVADRVEILGELGPVALRQRALQVRDLLAHRVEHAALLAEPREPHLRIGAGAVAEQPLEHHARVVLRRQRRVLALPADRVGVGARESGVARARRLARSRSPARATPAASCLPVSLREDLIHRDAGVEPGLAGRRRHVGEESRAGLRVRAARPARRRDAVEPAQHQHLLAERRQRARASASARRPAPSVNGR